MSGGGQEIFSVLHHINPRKEAVLLRTYIAKRLLALIPVMLVVASVVFTIIHLAPGNPAQVILGEEAHPDEVAALAHEMGYDRPLPVQLGKWFVRLSRGDLGSSVYYGKPVSSIVFQHAAPTIQLTLMAVMINILLGLVMGVLAAAYHNTLIDNSLMFIASIKVSLPISWLGLMLMLLFALKLKWFPVSGYVAFFEDPLKSVVYMFLPAFALGAGAAARLARMTRATMLEVLRSDYIRTARAKGVSEGSILFRHALKNCLVPIVTVVGLSMASMMGGAVVTETIFGIPGLGKLLITSVFNRDYPVIQGVVLYISLVYVLVNLCIDIIYGIIDPRISY
jgi:peptide/nickel transport system permease protein